MQKSRSDLKVRLAQLNMLTTDELLDFLMESKRIGNTTNARRIAFVLRNKKRGN